jgi:hypothetical protein
MKACSDGIFGPLTSSTTQTITGLFCSFLVSDQPLSEIAFKDLALEPIILARRKLIHPGFVSRRFVLERSQVL